MPKHVINIYPAQLVTRSSFQPVLDKDNITHPALKLWARLFKTGSLVHVSLKFLTLISEICLFCDKLLHCKASLICLTKNISVFGYKLVNHLAS